LDQLFDGLKPNSSVNSGSAPLEEVQTVLGKRRLASEKSSESDDVTGNQGAAYKRQKGCDQQESRSQIFRKAQDLAIYYSAQLVTKQATQLSVSHGQSSVRYTCVNDHNFFVACENIQSMTTKGSLLQN